MKGKIICKNCGRIIGKNKHICPEKNPMKGVHRFGKEASNWQGGRIIINGYIYVYSPKHPNRVFGNYVQEHRLVMEKKIGRFLKKDEIIHHIDENTFNNKIENLELVSRAKHNKIHKKKN